MEASLAKAVGGYSDERVCAAQEDRLLGKLADARQEGARFQELVHRPPPPEQAASASAQDDGDDDDDVAALSERDDGASAGARSAGARPADAAASSALEAARRHKDLGNASFGLAVGSGVLYDDMLAHAEDSAIYFLDALDALHAVPRAAFGDLAADRDALELVLLLNRSAALNKQGEWKLSLKASNAVLAKDPGNAKALYRRAVALAGLGRHADAEGDLARLVRLDPTNAAARRALSTARANVKQAAAHAATISIT
ncbi:hypothetical protein M885DRAFT_515171 [Pelagophyceae sp. CCMP2097]|nr:hypothetical protein M885DRAFT_515171 [Pelagophyceae sp. CCMP2097]